MIPVVTVIALGVPAIFGGAIITENVFKVNGIGQLLITALFLGVSIKLLEDRQLEYKGDAYREYRTSVPSALLLVPPPVGRWLGRQMCKAGGRGLC